MMRPQSAGRLRSFEQRCTASACKDGVNAALVSGRQRRIGLAEPPQALGLVDEGGLPPGLAIDFTNDLLRTTRHCVCIGQHERRIDPTNLSQEGAKRLGRFFKVDPVVFADIEAA